MSKWIGYAVSVNCAEPLGCYQGTILDADGSTITLTKAFRNGFPYPKSQVTLNAADIKDLKIIEVRTEPVEQTHSTVAVTKSNKKTSRSTVCENLQANPTNTGNQSAGYGCSVSGASKTPNNTRSKPIDIQASRNNKNNNNAGSFGGGGGGGGGGSGGGSGSTPKARVPGDKARRRNEACFGDAAHPALDDDFDFEGNLALFDKRALWESMRGSKPDLVRQADDAVSFRPDENVLGPAPAPRAPLRVPDELRGPRDYVTDEGGAVPSALPALRRRLWQGVRRLGLGEASAALLARAAADVALRLVGGGRRLDARNAHQAPRVAALCGAHAGGAAGLLAARLLHSHGARVQVALAGEPRSADVQRELGALRLDAVEAVRVAELAPADLVLLALHDPGAEEAGAGAGEAEARAWARASRGVPVALEPGAREAGCRASVVALLPPPPRAALGRVYLADVAAPRALFAEQRVLYRPPFGAHAVLPLHPADD